MKKLSLITVIFFCIINLNARENPFYATDVYEEELARIIEQDEILPQEQAYVNEYKKKLEEVKVPKNKTQSAIEKIVPILKTEKVYTKKELDKIIKKTKKQVENKTKKLIKKELSKKTIEEKQVVYVKPRPDAIVPNIELLKKNLLPFIDLSYNNEQLNIITKGKLFRKFTLKKEKKIVLDFFGRKNFYTIREKLNLKNFENITVGSHKNSDYYRVVVKLNNKVEFYEIKYKNSVVNIRYKN